MRENSNILMEKDDFNGTLNVSFSLFELKRVLVGARATSPGKDEICYKMVENLNHQAQ